MDNQWKTILHMDPGALGAYATAYDISLRVWYRDDSKLRMRGQVTLQYRASTGEFRIVYVGKQLEFATGVHFGSTVESSLVLPPPTEWILPKKAPKVSGRHTKGRVLVIGFTHGRGIMVDKLQIVFRITDTNDHGKFFIRTISCIRQAAVQGGAFIPTTGP
jgi:hypothetical protein